MQNSKTFPGKILQTPVLGERKVCFRSPKMNQLSYSNAEFKNFPGSISPDLRFSGRGGGICFHSPKMYQNSPT